MEPVTCCAHSGIPTGLPLCTEWAKRAHEELGETQETVENCLNILRKIIAENGNLRCPTDDGFLLCFLRVRKFNIQLAYKTLERYCQMHSDYPAMFQNHVPSKMESIYKQNITVILPQTDKLGRRIYIQRTGRWQPSICSLEEVFRSNMPFAELLMRDPQTQIAGVILLFDFAGATFHHLTNINPMTVVRGLKFLQNCLPLRYKEIHVINQPPLFSLLYSMAAPVLSKKIKTRMHFHGSDLYSLHQHIDSSYLPKDYGGIHSNEIMDESFQALMENEDYFTNLQGIGFCKTNSQ